MSQNSEGTINISYSRFQLLVYAKVQYIYFTESICLAGKKKRNQLLKLLVKFLRVDWLMNPLKKKACYCSNLETAATIMGT